MTAIVISMTKEQNLNQAISVGISIVIGLVLAKVIEICYERLVGSIWIIIAVLSSLILLSIIFLIVLDQDDIKHLKDYLKPGALVIFLSFFVNLPFAILRLFKGNITNFAGQVIPDSWGFKQLFFYALFTSVSFMLYGLTLKGQRRTILVTAGIIFGIISLFALLITWRLSVASLLEVV